MIAPMFLSNQVLRHSFLLGIVIASFASFSSNVSAQQTNRIWVDASGLHSVEASLIRLTKDLRSVVLKRSDGATITFMIDQLSNKDRQFIQDHMGEVIDRNQLRSNAPEAPDVEPLPILTLSSFVDESTQGLPADAKFEFDGPKVDQPSGNLPKSLIADPSPWPVSCPDSMIDVESVNFSDDVCRPVPILTSDDWDSQKASIGISICARTMLPGQPGRRQLIHFDVENERAIVAMQHVNHVRLCDHHLGSGRSLLLTDYGALGSGGSLGIVEGWKSNNVKFLFRRSLPVAKTSDRSMMTSSLTLHRARMVDTQHVLVHFDKSIVLWNLVSGKSIYRIDHVEPKCEPAISGGGRYFAVPGRGKVDLYATETGEPLGRIKVESQIPGVSFSPYGNALAIATSRRLRVWNLVGAALDADVSSRESLGQGVPTWVDHDLLITSTGVLVSQFRGLPVWKYDLASTTITRIGNRTAIFRKEPWSQLVTMTMPHSSAKDAMQAIDDSAVEVDQSVWRIPGRSSWDGRQWIDRSVRLSRRPKTRR